MAHGGQQIEFTEPQISEFKEAFEVYSQDCVYENKIPRDLLGTVLRSCNQMPTDAELLTYFDEIDVERTGYFDFNQVLAILGRRQREGHNVEEVRDAFAVFDLAGTEMIPAEYLKEILTTKGDVLLEPEMKEFLKQAKVDENGMVHYNDFVSDMMYSPLKKPKKGKKGKKK